MNWFFMPSAGMKASNPAEASFPHTL